MESCRYDSPLPRKLYPTSQGTTRTDAEDGKRISKTIRYMEYAHYGEAAGTYYMTCPYYGYKLNKPETNWLK